jgi:hypothetical protein
MNGQPLPPPPPHRTTQADAPEVGTCHLPLPPLLPRQQCRWLQLP